MFFQNCGRIDVSNLEKSAATGLTENGDGLANVNPPVVNGDIPVDPTNPATPTTPPTANTPPNIPFIPKDPAGNPMTPPPNGSWVYPNDEPKTASFYRQLCKNARLQKATVLNDGASLENKLGSQIASGSNLVEVHNKLGSTILAASHIKNLENKLGSTIVFNNGTTQTGLVDVATNGLGATILCGMSVTALRSDLGATIVVDADVRDVTNKLGTVVVIGGVISGNRDNKLGSIIQIP